MLTTVALSERSDDELELRRWTARVGPHVPCRFDTSASWMDCIIHSKQEPHWLFNKYRYFKRRTHARPSPLFYFDI
jgi:hypothetical protein